MRRAWVSAACAAFALSLAAPAAWSRCSGEWLCIEEIRDAGSVELRAANLRDVPLTLTLAVRTRDMIAEGPATVTETLPPRQSLRVMRLRPRGSDAAGRYRISYDWTVGSKDAVHDDDYVYRLPYASGKSYRVLQGYGSRFSHTGLEQFAVDFRMKEGTPVHAARDGVVARTEQTHSTGCWNDGCGQYANYVVILHDDGTTGEYYHLQKDGVLVEVGDRVTAGQRIALSGNTGHTTMPHLHFAVYRAAEWGTTQSVPVRFASAEGIVERPRRGARYRAR